MKTPIAATATMICVGTLMLAQAPAPAAQHGPGVQATRDSEYAAWMSSQCKISPPAAAAAPRGGGGAGGGAGRGGPGGGGNAAQAGPPAHREYTVNEIPGVVAAGQKWTSIWTGRGNNADGAIATDDGGILIAQNTDSAVLKLDSKGVASIAYKDTNTGGALSLSKTGNLFIVERGLPQSIWQLSPKRQVLTKTYKGEPLDCAGGLLNDLSADSKGGVYFTMGDFTTGGIYYASANGTVTKYGTVSLVNGILLSADEKILYATGRVPGGAAAAPAARGGGGGARGGGMVAYDVQADSSLTNERQFAEVGNDGITIDSGGRVYVTGGAGVEVVGPDGKSLGSIASPLGFVSLAFSGPDKKTLYGMANNQNYVEVFSIPMVAQGYRGRAK